GLAQAQFRLERKPVRLVSRPAARALTHGERRARRMGKKRANSQETSAPDMSDLLKRLEKWLARHRRHFLKGLLPGASPADLEELQKAVGVPLPADLKALLAWHNGQSDDCPGGFEQDWILLSSDRIAEVKRDLDGDAAAGDSGWKTAWVPFLDDDSGDYV